MANNNSFDINALNYNRSNNIYNTNNSININTFNYNKNDNIYGTNNNNNNNNNNYYYYYYYYYYLFYPSNQLYGFSLVVITCWTSTCPRPTPC